jgi:predicted amidohydrolase
MRLHDSLDDYREDLRRFLRVAQSKHAELVVFPELAGVLVTPPLLRDFRSALLKRADRGRRKQASLWQRFTGALAQRTAVLVSADLRTSLRALLDVAANEVWSAYSTLFAELAREFGVIIVAPSAYLPDPADGLIRNLTAVFGSNGDTLGYQTKVILPAEDQDLAQPGATWTPVQTPIGALGLMLGADVLFPEVGRLLAYQGAEILISLAACPTPVLYQKVRTGMLARMQDNQLFGVASFLVGPNDLSRQPREPFVGKSALFAPQELTPRFNGVLVEMGNQRSEGVLAAEYDFVALKKLWETSDTPVRKQLLVAQAGNLLAKLYDRLKRLPHNFDPASLPEVSGEALLSRGELLPTAVEPLRVDELPVISVVTRRWSAKVASQGVADAPLDLSELPEQLTRDWNDLEPRATQEESSSSPLVADDETDEMDALPDSSDHKSQ